MAARNVDRVIVATDSQLIVDAVISRGLEAMLTSETHLSGTDRIAEVAEALPEAQIIVNLQGDEPLISPETIDRAIEQMHQSWPVLMAPGLLQHGNLSRSSTI